LSPEDRNALLGLALETVAATTRGDRPPEPRNPSGPLREKGAAFVTLRVAEELRGCVGHIEPVSPLWESVREMAQAAAERDRRFPPLRPQELPGLRVEISVLSGMTPVRPEDVRVGLHGLYVARGSQTGLLLPQVAVEWGWDAREFLRRTYEKAGLPHPDPDARIFAFTVDRFANG
jgi:AmmeMemoRadiSam system protein A